MTSSLLELASLELEKVLSTFEDKAGHGIEHMHAVHQHAVEALKYEDLSAEIKAQIEFAALLHDADDEKLFPSNKANENTRHILMESKCPLEWHQLILEMINLVSCSKNGDRDPPLKWMAIPRDCDRLEAIGEIGIQRCKEFTDAKKSPYHLPTTIHVKSLDELSMAASTERFMSYSKGGKSLSMLDHYYDKLLHIGKPEALKSQNVYILSEALRRNHIMAEYVVNYWKTVEGDC